MKTFHLFQRGDKVRSFLSVPFWPVWLGQHVINDIESGGHEQLEGFFKQAIFAGPSVCKDEFKLRFSGGLQKLIAVGADHGQPRIPAQMIS